MANGIDPDQTLLPVCLAATIVRRHIICTSPISQSVGYLAADPEVVSLKFLLSHLSFVKLDNGIISTVLLLIQEGK